MLYFIVRTDVNKYSGMQRVFACFDSRDEADRELVNIVQHRVGVFKIFSGEEIPGQ